MSRMCSPAYCIPLYGSMTVISPEDRKKKNPQIYHLHDTAVVLMWTTRERSKTTCWVRDVLDNVWIVIRNEREDD